MRPSTGYVFGAFQTKTGEVFTATYIGRALVNCINLSPAPEEWIPKDVERVYTVLDNLTMPRVVDVLFFDLAYPQPAGCITKLANVVNGKWQGDTMWQLSSCPRYGRASAHSHRI